MATIAAINATVIGTAIGIQLFMSWSPQFRDRPSERCRRLAPWTISIDQMGPKPHGMQGVMPPVDRPCRARPADRSLVAEDRSAKGVRDRTGPKPRCSRDCSRDAPQHPGMSEYRTGRRSGIRPARRPGRRQDSTGQHTACAIWVPARNCWALPGAGQQADGCLVRACP
jgi:hypothetical protein